MEKKGPVRKESPKKSGLFIAVMFLAPHQGVLERSVEKTQESGEKERV